MKTIIAGSRSITDPRPVFAAIADAIGRGLRIFEVVSGDARGVDQFGAQWAGLQNIKVKHFPANWTAEGRAAGPKRNERMAAYAQAAIIIWDGQSHGSRHMITTARAAGLQVYAYTLIDGHLYRMKEIDL